LNDPLALLIVHCMLSFVALKLPLLAAKAFAANSIPANAATVRKPTTLFISTPPNFGHTGLAMKPLPI
jgi:hypothetical protein